MNEFAAYPEPTIGGYFVMLRFPKDGQPKPVLSSPKRPHIVPTEREAWAECTKHLLKWVNGNFRSERDETTADKADDLFPSLSPIRRNGRVIPVASKKRNAR